MGNGARVRERTVPVLISGDVDFSKHHPYDEKLAAFDRVLEAADTLGANLTLFFVAREAEQVPEYPRRFVLAGHEVGCHGLTHGDEENYETMPHELQKEYLQEATSILREIAGVDIVSFRAPRVKISSTTHRLLVDLGYVVDSTICSQRFDLISSNLIHVGWLSSPRLPYHPSRDNAYRRGDLDVLEVPVSALAVPFISSALYVLGPWFMKMFFRFLYAESRRTGKPIVYLFHPYEFATEIVGAKRYDRSIGVHGFQFRRHLYRGDPRDKLSWNLELWNFMRSFPGVHFMTMRQFVDHFGSERAS